MSEKMNERIGSGGGGKRRRKQGKKGKNIIKINCSSAFYKVVVNNKILKAVETPLQ